MCEVLAISANKPVGVSFSWRAFEERGRPNPDGWGYAYRTDAKLRRRRYARTLRPDDQVANLTGEVESPVFLAHVRRGVQGPPTKENAQPFLASTVDIAGVLTVSRGCRMTARYSDPVGNRREGSTGAELLFWVLVSGAQEHGGLVPPLRQVVETAFDPGKLQPGAQSSFVLTDGRTLLAFRHGKPLWRVIREPPHDGTVRLRDPDLPPYKAQLRLHKKAEERASVFATVRLTRGEEWHQLADRTLVAVRDGREVWRKPLDRTGGT